jgi:hypothetical protein
MSDWCQCWPSAEDARCEEAKCPCAISGRTHVFSGYDSEAMYFDTIIKNSSNSTIMSEEYT